MGINRSKNFSLALTELVNWQERQILFRQDRLALHQIYLFFLPRHRTGVHFSISFLVSYGCMCECGQWEWVEGRYALSDQMHENLLQEPPASLPVPFANWSQSLGWSWYPGVKDGKGSINPAPWMSVRLSSHALALPHATWSLHEQEINFYCVKPSGF